MMECQSIWGPMHPAGLYMESVLGSDIYWGGGGGFNVYYHRVYLLFLLEFKAYSFHVCSLVCNTSEHGHQVSYATMTCIDRVTSYATEQVLRWGLFTLGRPTNLQ